MNVLVTGASGFVGEHLVEALIQSNKEKLKIFGTRMQRVENREYSANVTWLDGDLTEESFVQHCIEVSMPDQVYHLAAAASAGASFANPDHTLVNNIKSQGYLLEAIKKSSFRPRILIVGSVEENGWVAPDITVDENTALNPVSPYGVSKIAQDYMGLQYFNSEDLDIVRVRPSNHIGPGQSAKYVVASWCKQVAQIEQGVLEPILKVGNTSVIRDFTDVRDMANAYILALDSCQAGEVYVIGSGEDMPLKELLNLLMSQAEAKIDIEQDPKLIRPKDIERIVVNPAKFIQATGWKRQITFEATLHDILNYWRKSVTEEK